MRLEVHTKHLLARKEKSNSKNKSNSNQYLDIPYSSSCPYYPHHRYSSLCASCLYLPWFFVVVVLRNNGSLSLPLFPTQDTSAAKVFQPITTQPSLSLVSFQCKSHDDFSKLPSAGLLHIFISQVIEKSHFIMYT
jgi:hypothetical protein